MGLSLQQVVPELDMPRHAANGWQFGEVRERERENSKEGLMSLAGHLHNLMQWDPFALF